MLLIAARHDQPLPALPVPTHTSFKPPLSLESLLGLKDSSNPAFPPSASVLLDGITVADAIGDLPLFDWYVSYID
jgi:hypothetical protein